MNEMRCPLSRTAERIPDLPAIISSKRTISFKELEQLVHRTASNLKETGVQRHSLVAILGNNSLEYCLLILSTLRIGAIVCPINHRWPKGAIQNALIQTDCHDTILTDSNSGESNLQGTKVWSADKLVPTRAEQSVFRAQPVIQLNNPATIIFTSGTGSEPKAALLSYGNYYYNALGANQKIPFHEGHRWLLSLPLYHVGGLGILFRAIIGGGAIVISEKDQSILDAISKYEITHLSLVPTQLYRLLREHKFRFANSNPIVLTGGGPISPELLEKAQTAGLKIYRTYGLTEMASQVTTYKSGKKMHSGKLLRHRQLKIADTGEILVKGKTLFLGYTRNGNTELPVDVDGWFHTGDIGELDNRGFLTVHGRKDNMINSGGENIHPEEIESRLMQLEYIEEALVVGISDEEYGLRPAAFVRFVGGNRVSDKEIIAALEITLPRYKIPKIYLDWPEPLTEGTLKLNRARFLKLANDMTVSRLRKTPEAAS